MEDIWSYSALQWSPAKADDYTRQLLTAFADLASGTRSGMATIARRDYRRLLVGSHMIFYRERADRLDIIRVLHQSIDERQHL